MAKRLFVIPLLILCLCFPLTAFADEEAAEEATEETTSEAAEIEYTETVLDESESTSGFALPDAVSALFGEYTPRTQTVTEYYSDGSTVEYTEVVPGLAGLDWTYISSVGLFSMSLYCIFRLVGGIFKWT